MKLLKYPNDLRPVFLVLLSTFLLISPLFGIFTQYYWVPIKIIFAVICHVINHSHQHLGLFNRTLYNNLFSVVLSLNLGQSGTGTIAMHQLNHHGHNNSELDMANSRLVKYRWNFLNLLFYPFIIISNYRKMKHSLLKELEGKRSGIKKVISIELWVIRIFAFAYLLIDWKLFLLFVLIPYIFGVWAILAINLIQHQLTNEKNEHHHSTNFTGFFLNYFFLNNGYHSVHHQHPNLHWSLLPTRHKEIAKNIPPLFIKKSLVVFILKHFIFNFKKHSSLSHGRTFNQEQKFDLSNQQSRI